MEAALLEFENEIPEEDIVGSRNHAYVQSLLVAELVNLNQFAVYTELSLDIEGKEYVPDIALYRQTVDVDGFQEDILRMNEMPVCAIEILSPRQFIESLTAKFKVYFSAGIQSCWLVIPNLQQISVYSAMQKPDSFTTGEMIDEALNIRLPLNRVFRSIRISA